MEHLAKTQIHPHRDGDTVTGDLPTALWGVVKITGKNTRSGWASIYDVAISETFNGWMRSGLR